MTIVTRDHDNESFGGGSLTGTYVLWGGKLHWNKQYRGTNSAAANLLIKNRTGGDGTNSRDTHWLYEQYSDIVHE